MQHSNTELLRKYLSIGLSILPVNLKNGSVKPLITEWQTKKQVTEDNLKDFDCNAWGLITGQLSGNLEVIDFDEKHRKGIFERWLNNLSPEGKGLIKRLPLSTTKSGGFHILYRCKTIAGNMKLAKTPDGECMIETRGEGGFVFEYPTPKYKFINKLSLLCEITEIERASLLKAARDLDETPSIQETKVSHLSTGDTIFDEFNSKMSWKEILEPMGWKIVGKHGEEIMWQRPGKDDKSISATENYKGLGLFHVFTTSSDLPDGKSYNKFQAYAFFEHNGDNKKAVQAIRAKGYGKEKIVVKAIEQQPVVIDNNNGLFFVRASTVKPKAIDWLWHDKIAKGKISLIAGDPGLGKSQISINIASIVSTGGYFPLGHKAKEGRVLMFSAEDGIEDTIAPRFEASKANMENILILSSVKKQGKEKTFNFQEDLPMLEKTLETEKNVALIVIDPITAFLGDTDSHVNAEVRALLYSLSKLAEKYNIAILVVTHLNKGSGNSPINKVTGSLAFVAAVRSAFMVIQDEQDSYRRILSPIKNNLAKDRSGLAYRIEPVTIQNGIEASRVIWEKEPINMSVTEILKEQNNSRGSVDKKTVEWLENYVDKFSNGISPTSVETAAIKAGISRGTLFRAKKEAMIIAKPTGNKNEKVWISAVNMVDDDDINPEDVPL